VKELFRLFLIMLKIGATAFGGNVALVAAVRKELCEKRNMLSDEQLVDFMTIGNLLPGPFATNVITASGYAIRGMIGAAICLFAVLLPAFVLLCVFSFFYLRYGQLPVIERVFSGLLPGVAAIIAYTAFSLAKTNVKKPFQIALLILAGVVSILVKSYLTTFSVIVVAGLIGYIIAKRNPNQIETVSSTPALKRSHLPLIISIIISVLLLALYFADPVNKLLVDLRMITLSFSGMSVTLFGGGYVFIPAIESVVVTKHQWVTSREFADAIAISQVTPGPISISAAFVGWKVAGLKGALLGTLGIFVPPALLTIMAQQTLMKLKNRPGVIAVFSGVRPAVIGLIAASIWVIGKSAPLNWHSALIFVVVLTLAIWKKLDTALLIFIAGVMGWVLYQF
jgi:chromate transporter